ncbi:MAG: antitoxin [Pseudomonadota bacterium]
MNSKLDNEDQEILALFEQRKLKRSDDSHEEVVNAKVSAAEHVGKSARINIRLSPVTLDKIKKIAQSEGLPYQTLIASILYQYVNKDTQDKSL